MTNMRGDKFAYVEGSALHAEILAALHDSCFDVSWSIQEFQDLLTSPGIFVLIVQQGTSEPCGLVVFRAASDECEILTIGVLPGWRRHKIAASLLDRIIVQMRDIGVSRVFLEVAKDNEAALKLYQGQGFQEVGRRRKYYKMADGRIDALILAKTIF
jgi:ribosomal-protein-alanine N-acetyltransferase